MDIRSQFAGRYKTDMSIENLRAKVARRKSITQKENRHKEFRKSRGLALVDMNVSVVKEQELTVLEEVDETFSAKATVNKTAASIKNGGTISNERRLMLQRFREEKELRKLKEQREKASKGVFKCGIYKPETSLIPVFTSQQAPKVKPKEKPAPLAPVTRVTRSAAKIEAPVHNLRSRPAQVPVLNNKIPDRNVPRGRGQTSVLKKNEKENKATAVPSSRSTRATAATTAASRLPTVKGGVKNMTASKPQRTKETSEKEIALTKPKRKEKVEPEVTMHEKVEPEVTMHEKVEPEVTMHEKVEPEVTMHEKVEPEVTMHEKVEPEVTMHEKVEPEVTMHEKVEPEVTMHEKVEPEVTMHEKVEPEVTMHEKVEPEVTMHEKVEPEVTMHEKVEPEVTMHEKVEPEVTMHEKVEPEVTMHEKVEPEVTMHEKVEPEVTMHEKVEPEVTMHEKVEPEVTMHEKVEPEVTMHEKVEPEVTMHEKVEPEVTMHEKVEPEVTMHEKVEPEVTMHEKVEPEVTMHEKVEPEVTMHEKVEPEVTMHEKVEPEVTMHEKVEPEVTMHEKVEPEVTVEVTAEESGTLAEMKTSVCKEPKPSFAPENFVFQPLDGLSTFKFQPMTPKRADAFLTPTFTWSPVEGKSNFVFTRNCEENGTPNVSPPDLSLKATNVEMDTCTSSETKDSSSETPVGEDFPPKYDQNTCMPTDNPLQSEVVCHDVPYFRALLETEIQRLTVLCTEWEKRIDQDIPEDSKDVIRTTVGQTRLLMTERFKQFRGLVDNCEFKLGEKETTCTDLDGFWDMIYFQIEDVSKKFVNLGKMEENSWQQTAVQTKKVVRKKAVPAATVNKSQGDNARAAARSRLAAIKAAMRNKAKQEEVMEEATVSEQPMQVDPVVFDAGFFRIESPAKLPGSLRTAKTSSQTSTTPKSTKKVKRNSNNPVADDKEENVDHLRIQKSPNAAKSPVRKALFDTEEESLQIQEHPVIANTENTESEPVPQVVDLMKYLVPTTTVTESVADSPVCVEFLRLNTEGTELVEGTQLEITSTIVDDVFMGSPEKVPETKLPSPKDGTVDILLDEDPKTVDNPLDFLGNCTTDMVMHTPLKSESVTAVSDLIEFSPMEF